MKNLSATTILLLSLMLYVGCKTVYRTEVKEAIQFKDYNMYVFKLCERINVPGNERYFLCNDIVPNIDSQVIEELYALQHKKIKESIIYFTSKSNKSVSPNRGIFNSSEYQNHIFVNDFEFVYIGNIIDSLQIRFLAPKEILTFSLTTFNEEQQFLIDSIYSVSQEKNTISNKRIKLEDLYAVPLEFVKTNRAFAYRSSRREIKRERKRILPIVNLHLEGKAMNFKDQNGEILYSISQTRRLRYHPSFEKHLKPLLRPYLSKSISYPQKTQK